jgi:hypothetical protein
MPGHFTEKDLTHFVRQVHRLTVMVDDSEILFTNFLSTSAISGFPPLGENAEGDLDFQAHGFKAAIARAGDRRPQDSLHLHLLPGAKNSGGQGDRRLKSDLGGGKIEIQSGSDQFQVTGPPLQVAQCKYERPRAIHSIPRARDSPAYGRRRSSSSKNAISSLAVSTASEA